MKKSLFTALLLAASLVPAEAQRSNHNFEVAKNLDIFNALYRDLDLYYVDTLNAARNIENAANYMLAMLDPYTEYYPSDNTDDLKQLATGKYGGVGIVTNYRGDLGRCFAAEIFEGMPADRAGVLPGDVILSVDGHNFERLVTDDKEKIRDYSTRVASLMRGDAGTTMELKVLRPGQQDKTYLFKVTRRQIVRPSVTLATLASDSVGYIRLSQFIDGTSNEVRRSVVELKQQGARSLILDLRDNPGGVLEEAVKTVNLFIPRGREVVRTKSKVRELNSTFRTQLDAQDTDLPIVVLTNEGSASAAEITSGALQDYDRAVILGRRTYGKGLVQQSRELPYGAMFKLTTGRYYIPSGRCVQAYKFEDGEPVHLPDSLSREFHTANGRTVRDGGGITPDVVMPTDSLPNLLLYLENSNQLFDYSVRYCQQHPNIVPARQFRLTAEEYADFCNYMKQHNFTYDRQSSRVLEMLRKMVAFEGYDSEATAEIESLEKKLKHNEDYDFKRWEAEIRQIVEGEIVEKYYYEKGREEYELQSDPYVQRAVEILHAPKTLHKILSGEPEA